MSARMIYLIGFFTICLILGGSFYLQFVDGIMPCPLCTFQRFAFLLLGLGFLFGVLVSSRMLGRLIVNIILTISALFGLVFAGRQVWLQHFSNAQNADCGVSLQYMLNILPIDQVIKKVFQGSAECRANGFQFLSLNMAEWSFIWFVLFLFLSVYLFLKERKWQN